MNDASELAVHDVRTISVRHVNVFPIITTARTFITASGKLQVGILVLGSLLVCLPRSTDHMPRACIHNQPCIVAFGV